MGARKTPQLQQLDFIAASAAKKQIGRAEQQHNQKLRVAGLFAGIGGIELGLADAGHETSLLCENEPTALAVIEDRLAPPRIQRDVRTLKALPRGTTLVTAGFPCQDLSQAGKTAGISGARSGLVGEVFRLLEKGRTPWVLLENVPFMLQLAKGQALEVIVSALEHLGYAWAYRVVDSRAFGVPQRRERVFLLASRVGDPREVLLSEDVGEPEPIDHRKVACGFYWTEGIRGLGWAVDAVPTLKGGSTIGIPSPPAILMPRTGDIVKPDIRDAERLQGFAADWTKPAEQVAKRGARWKLVGNAVTVNVSRWIGERLAAPLPYDPTGDYPLRTNAPWPRAAWNLGQGRHGVNVSAWPRRLPRAHLTEFLQFEPELLSLKATAGFLARTETASLRFPDGFIPAVRAHLDRMSSAAAA